MMRLWQAELVMQVDLEALAEDNNAMEEIEFANLYPVGHLSTTEDKAKDWLMDTLNEQLDPIYSDIGEDKPEMELETSKDEHTGKVTYEWFNKKDPDERIAVGMVCPVEVQNDG